MKKIIIKTLCLILSLTFFITSALPAFAVSDDPSPISITIKSKKEKYTFFGIADITVEISNESSYPLTDVNVDTMFENIHPVDCNTADLSGQYDSIAPNSSKTLSFKAMVDKSASGLTLFQKLFVTLRSLFHKETDVEDKSYNDERDSVEQMKTILFGKVEGMVTAKVRFNQKIEVKSITSNIKEIAVGKSEKVTFNAEIVSSDNDVSVKEAYVIDGSGNVVASLNDAGNDDDSVANDKVWSGSAQMSSEKGSVSRYYVKAVDTNDNSFTSLKFVDICFYTTQINLEDTSIPVRPALVNGQPFWNDNVMFFMYAPSFSFKKVLGAVKYRYEVIDDLQKRHTFTADGPNAFLTPVWNDLPAGFVSVTVYGIGLTGSVIKEAGRRVFVKKAQFTPGAYPEARRSYIDTARLIFDYCFSTPEVQDLINGKGIHGFNFITKQFSQMINAAARMAKLFPERKEEALKIVRCAADYMSATLLPADSPLANLAPTFREEDADHAQDVNTIKMLEPVMAIDAFIDAYYATNDEKYLSAAKAGADTLVNLQGEDGSWPYFLRLDGTELTSNRCVTVRFFEMFEKLYEATGDIRYRKAADKAFKYIENGPMTTWNWEGQFEDTPVTAPYENLTKHDACSTAIYILKRFPGDKERLAQAREMLRFAEDVFVFWENPFKSGRIIQPEPGKGYYAHYWDQTEWICPCVTEQFGCFTPVDASAAKLIRTYIALYEAEHDPLDLAKARALGDNATRMTDDDGLESTWWCTTQLRQDIWPNCMLAVEWALEELIELEDINIG